MYPCYVFPALWQHTEPEFTYFKDCFCDSNSDYGLLHYYKIATHCFAAIVAINRPKMKLLAKLAVAIIYCTSRYDQRYSTWKILSSWPKKLHTEWPYVWPPLSWFSLFKLDKLKTYFQISPQPLNLLNCSFFFALRTVNEYSYLTDIIWDFSRLYHFFLEIPTNLLNKISE